jgi:hypothetical protein
MMPQAEPNDDPHSLPVCGYDLSDGGLVAIDFCAFSFHVPRNGPPRPQISFSLAHFLCIYPA